MSQALTAAQLTEVASHMTKGESVVYFTGHLAESAGENVAVSQLRDVAQRMSTMRMSSPTGALYVGMRMIALSQRRVATGMEYIATRL